MTPPRLCVECKWYAEQSATEYAKCSKPIRSETSLVTGVTTEVAAHHGGYCTLQRSDAWYAAYFNGTCGKRGRFWEGKV